MVEPQPNPEHEDETDPSAVEAPEEQGLQHSDGTLFSDGTGYA